MVAAVQDRGQIERFLRHLDLWPEATPITEIRGPPELFELPEVEPTETQDEIDEPPANDWTA